MKTHTAEQQQLPPPPVQIRALELLEPVAPTDPAAEFIQKAMKYTVQWEQPSTEISDTFQPEPPMPPLPPHNIRTITFRKPE